MKTKDFKKVQKKITSKQSKPGDMIAKVNAMKAKKKAAFMGMI